MRAPTFKVFAFMLVLSSAATTGAIAEAIEPKDAVQEIAAQSSLLTHIDTIYRLTEELVFWQSVAVMGGAFDWEIIYNAQEAVMFPWTYPLYNALDEAEIEAVRAAKGIARSKIATEVDKRAGEDLFAQHLEMRAVANEIQVALKDGRTAEAAALFETRTLALRREIANAAYSASARLRKNISSTALKVRINNK